MRGAVVVDLGASAAALSLSLSLSLGRTFDLTEPGRRREGMHAVMALERHGHGHGEL
jgi:hypothetical protein